MSKKVYIVHSIDTEGPLTEQTHGFDYKKQDNFYEDSDIDFAAFSSKELKSYMLKHRSKVLGTWPEVIDMLRSATSLKSRMRLPDSNGNSWIFNWFCMDHLGFVDNPRGRSFGIHQIFDVYKKIVDEQQLGDSIEWHFHPMSTYKGAHHCSTSYFDSSELYDILCRRIIDRQWFPRVNRQGCHAERPDSHLFLEQWIPFDMSNISSDDLDPVLNADMLNGQFGDWRWAPNDWSTYHPDHNCYQKEGNCSRLISRSLNLLNRFGTITPDEVRKAFSRAQKGEPTILGVVSHDWRNLVPEMAQLQSYLKLVSAEFPDVSFEYSSAVDAFRKVSTPPELSLRLDCVLHTDKEGLPDSITITQKEGTIFGSQPFLAIKRRSREYLQFNLNYGHSLNDFNFIFGEQTILPNDVEVIGIAANDAYGNQSIHTIKVDSFRVQDLQGVSF